jgi:hypothetical protein
VVGMMNVLAILLLFVGLALLAAIPLVIMLHMTGTVGAVDDVTPRDPV